MAKIVDMEGVVFFVLLSRAEKCRLSLDNVVKLPRKMRECKTRWRGNKIFARPVTNLEETFWEDCIDGIIDHDVLLADVTWEEEELQECDALMETSVAFVVGEHEEESGESSRGNVVESDWSDSVVQPLGVDVAGGSLWSDLTGETEPRESQSEKEVGCDFLSRSVVHFIGKQKILSKFVGAERGAGL